jgi:hypothetical protein
MRERAHLIPMPISGTLFATSCHPSDPSLLLAWELGGRVWCSHDAGVSWTESQVLGIHPDLLFCEQAWWALNGRCILLPALGPHIGWISMDAGKTFREVPAPWASGPPPKHPIAVMTRTMMTREGVICAGWSLVLESRQRDWKVQLSKDGGATWDIGGRAAMPSTGIYPTPHAAIPPSSPSAMTASSSPHATSIPNCRR